MKRRSLGLGVVLVGNLLFGWGLYKIMGVGSCGGLRPACPASSWAYFVAMPLGILLSMIGIFTGGAIGFVSIFMTVGIASILRGINGGVGGDGGTTFPFVFGALFLLPPLLPLLAWPFLRGRKKRSRGLVDSGTKAVATVTSIRDTGVTIDNSPRVELALRVEPEGGGAAFDTTCKLTVSRLAIPRVGDRYPVWYDPQDTSRFRIGDLMRSSPEAAPAPETEWVSELGRLNELRLAGALTDEEFTRAKDRLLAGSPPAPAGG